MAGLQLFTSNCAVEAGNHPWKKAGTEFGVPTLEKGDVLHHKFGVVDN